MIHERKVDEDLLERRMDEISMVGHKDYEPDIVKEIVKDEIVKVQDIKARF